MLSIDENTALYAELTDLLGRFAHATRGDIYQATKRVLDDLNRRDTRTDTLAADLIDSLAEHPEAPVYIEGEPFGAFIYSGGKNAHITLHSISGEDAILANNCIDPHEAEAEAQTLSPSFTRDVLALLSTYPRALATFARRTRGALSRDAYSLVQVYDGGVCHHVTSPPVDDTVAEDVVHIVQDHNEALRPDDPDNACCFCGRRGTDSLCDIHRYRQQCADAARQQRVGDAAVARAQSGTARP